MPTPVKPFAVLTAEKKSHRTKKELKQRKQAEDALTTGYELQERSEVKENPTAHKEFIRVTELLATIGKNDAIYETIINRYCMMIAECAEFEKKREQIYNRTLELDKKSKDMEPDEYFKLVSQFQKSMIDIDKQIQQKRKMLFDIEKENVMTIAAALRSIPKAPDKKGNALKDVLNG